MNDADEFCRNFIIQEILRYYPDAEINAKDIWCNWAFIYDLWLKFPKTKLSDIFYKFGKTSFTKGDILKLKTFPKAKVIEILTGIYKQGKIKKSDLRLVLDLKIISLYDYFSILSENDLIEEIYENDFNEEILLKIFTNRNLSKKTWELIIKKIITDYQNNILTKKFIQTLLKLDNIPNDIKDKIGNIFSEEIGEIISEINIILKKINYDLDALIIDNKNPELYKKLRILVQRGITLNRKELINYFGKYVIDYILRGYPEELVFNETLLVDELPNLPENYTQIFVLGNAGSGKSMFLGGLMYYALNNTMTTPKILFSQKGYKYLEFLVNAIKHRRLVGSNPMYDFHYFAVDTLEEKKSIFGTTVEYSHPLAFYEISGDFYKREIRDYFIIGKELNAKLKYHIFDSPNRKLIFLLVSYDEVMNSYKFGENPTFIHDAFLTNLAESGTLDKVLAINLVITKWDLAPQGLNVVDFTKKYLLSLHQRLISFEKTTNIVYGYLQFSLGKFRDVIVDERLLKENGMFVQYEPTYSKAVYDWIIKVSPKYKL